jgi:hypothetical protein
MKALSLSQPMAWAVFHGKDIENRSWRTNFRGRIIIHAALSFNMDHYRFMRDDLGVFLMPNPKEYVHGALIGEVDIVDCVMYHTSRWFLGEWGFVLRNAKAYDKPIRYKGQLGLFEVPDSLVH